MLARGGEPLAAAVLDAPSRHNAVLAPAVDRLLRGQGLAARDLAGVACVRGPGSFTGLRMSLAFALGLARGASLPLAGLEHLPLIAAGRLPLLSGAGTLAVLTHSRRRQVYVQAFSASAVAALFPVLAVGLERLPALLAGLPPPLRLVGSGATENREALAGLLPGAGFLDPALDGPTPEALARAACAADYSLAPIEPFYLRASDAEDNLPSFAAARGLDPDEARRRLDAATGRGTAAE